MKLYELPERYSIIMDQIADGELTPELEAELDLLDANLQAKTDSICKMIAQLTREAESADAEAARLKLRASSRDNAARRLKDYLRLTLEKIGQDRVKTDLFTCYLQASPPAIEWRGRPTELPPYLMRTIVELDKKAALEAWQEGKTLPDGMTVKQNRHLRIK